MKIWTWLTECGPLTRAYIKSRLADIGSSICFHHLVIAFFKSLIFRSLSFSICQLNMICKRRKCFDKIKSYSRIYFLILNIACKIVKIFHFYYLGSHICLKSMKLVAFYFLSTCISNFICWNSATFSLLKDTVLKCKC